MNKLFALLTLFSSLNSSYLVTAILARIVLYTVRIHRPQEQQSITAPPKGRDKRETRVVQVGVVVSSCSTSKWQV